MNIPWYMKKTLLLLSFAFGLATVCDQYKHFTNPLINQNWPGPMAIYNTDDDH